MLFKNRNKSTKEDLLKIYGKIPIHVFISYYFCYGKSDWVSIVYLSSREAPNGSHQISLHKIKSPSWFSVSYCNNPSWYVAGISWVFPWEDPSQPPLVLILTQRESWWKLDMTSLLQLCLNTLRDSLAGHIKCLRCRKHETYA